MTTLGLTRGADIVLYNAPYKVFSIIIGSLVNTRKQSYKCTHSDYCRKKGSCVREMAATSVQSGAASPARRCPSWPIAGTHTAPQRIRTGTRAACFHTQLCLMLSVRRVTRVALISKANLLWSIIPVSIIFELNDIQIARIDVILKDLFCDL